MFHVSAIIPVYNGERFIREALESVLEQTRLVDEIIVIDDGSTDRSGSFAQTYRGVRCFRQNNGGQAAALNAGIAAAAGDCLAFLDADDSWLPGKLALQLAALRGQPELELVFGHARLRVEPGSPAATTLHGKILPARLPSAMLLRRSAWQRVGPFKSDWTLGSAIEWCARAHDRGVRSKLLDEVVYERRIHRDNVGLSHAHPAGEYAQMLKAVLDRRRQESDT